MSVQTPASSETAEQPRPPYPRGDISPISRSGMAVDRSGSFAALEALEKEIEAKIRETIDWYYRKRVWPRRIAQGLRFAAAVCAAAGGLVPVVSPLTPAVPLALGYALLGAGVSFILLNRALGCSSAWIRYVKSALQLNQILDRHIVEWTITAPLIQDTAPPAEQAKAVDLIRSLSSDLHVVLSTETDAWIAQFNSDLNQLEGALQARLQPGEKPARSAAA